MDLSMTAVTLAFLALPGLVASQLYRKWRGRRQKEAWESFVEILFFSLISYSLYVIVEGASVYAWHFFVPPAQPTTRPTTQPAGQQAVAGAFDGLLAILYDKTTGPAVERLLITVILPTCAISVILAALASLAHSNSWVCVLGQRSHVSSRAGDEDVWEQFLNTKRIRWVQCRDKKTGLAFYGAIKRYSDSGRIRELVLEKVKVTDSASGAFLYEAKTIYLAREASDLTIECEISGVPATEVPPVKDTQPAQNNKEQK